MAIEPWPPTGPTTAINVIPSYLYAEYADDEDLQSFVDAYNGYAQSYVDYLNNLNLPIYTQGTIVGPLLDWVGLNLYGMLRPSLPTQSTSALGEFNTYQYNTLKFNQAIPATQSPLIATTDDIFKRILTWHFYKGDGKTFSPTWLKRRVERFLNGLNGGAPPIDNTYDVSVNWTAPKEATITVPNTPMGTVFALAVEGGVLELPIQTTWSVLT